MICNFEAQYNFTKGELTGWDANAGRWEVCVALEHEQLPYKDGEIRRVQQKQLKMKKENVILWP